ncbi:MAG: hypothetical protein DRP74_07570 [Candidatus Omnitrophota bacterium]|nr:MAG: hypothetical protein DRP74_07570 [Candidatus Omnitrophota bacterium]
MALADIFRYPNWVDIFIIILFARIAYNSLKTSLPAELFKLLGTFHAAYFSLHYYTALTRALPFSDYIGENFVGFFVFLILLFAGYYLFVLLRKIFFRLVNIQAENKLNIWGGFFAGLLRGILAVSLLAYAFAISPVKYFRNSVEDSFSARFAIKAAPMAYIFYWNKVMSKFMTGEEFNENLFHFQGEVEPAIAEEE